MSDQVYIYCIRCTVNGKVYIGVTYDVTQRWPTHRSKLNCSKHDNKALQADWNAYGKSAFEHSILEQFSRFDPARTRITQERHWIAKYRSEEPAYGYNVNFKVMHQEKSIREADQRARQRIERATEKRERIARIKKQRDLAKLLDKLQWAYVYAKRDGRELDMSLYQRQANDVKAELYGAK